MLVGAFIVEDDIAIRSNGAIVRWDGLSHLIPSQQRIYRIRNIYAETFGNSGRHIANVERIKRMHECAIVKTVSGPNSHLGV